MSKMDEDYGVTINFIIAFKNNFDIGFCLFDGSQKLQTF
jgi:hypothetical protein